MEARKQRMLALALLMLILNSYGVYSVDLESSKEIPCFTPGPSQLATIDVAWYTSLTTLYYPYMSRHDLYGTALDLTELDPKDLAEDALYYNSCLTYEMIPGGFIEYGFGTKRKKFLIQPSEPFGVFGFSNEGDPMATCYTTLTDNRSFFLTINCNVTGLGLMSWSVLSAVQSLPEQTVKLIHNHVESLGFKREQFTGLRYQSCPGVQPDGNKPGQGTGHGWSN